MKKITKIWGVGLIVVLLISLLGIAIPASAGTLTLTAETPPTSLDNILVTSANLTDIAVSDDGATIWVATGNTSLYKSTNAGETWTEVTPAVSSVTTHCDLVAIAPDNNEIVVVAKADATTVAYLSTNGGSTWATLSTIAESDGDAASVLTDLAISAAAAGINYIAVSGAEAGGQGNVWYFNVGAAAPAWKETNDKYGWGTTGTFSAATTENETLAVAFSPNFPSDRVLVAVTVNASEAISLQMYSTSSSKWNTAAGFDGYPPILSAAGALLQIQLAIKARYRWHPPTSPVTTRSALPSSA